MEDFKGESANTAATEKQMEESSVTMLDVLEQEKEMEQEYAAVLGASDEKFCTYAAGPIARQALYSCLTCCPDARNNLDKCAGICLACSYRCHEHHELVELYTKRNFRCDCPTERLGGNRCVLNVALGKPAESCNAANLYNQNFQGLYCNCHRPYPDPERTTEEVMLQCAVCEDWFHLQHVNAPPSAAKLIDACSEMICDGCMKRHSFLKDYSGLALRALDDLDESALNVTVSGDVSLCEGEDNDNKLRSDLDKSISEIMNMGEVGPATPQPNSSETASKVNEPESKGQKEENLEEQKCESEEEPQVKRQKLDDAEEKKSDAKDPEPNKCRRPTSKSEYEKGATFWGNDWRAALCQCPDCLELYKSQNVEFLLDSEDSAKTYEERGIKRAATESSSYEQGIRALATIGHVQQIDAITEYNRMKDKLKEYLQTFAATKKVVTEEDINRFFQEMRNEKNTNVGQPHFCR